MNDRLSWRNSIEHTVSSSNSSRTGRTVGTAFGFGGAAFAAFGAGFAGFPCFGAGFALGFAARLGFDDRRGFRAIVAGIRKEH